jgi:hypothetical protein
MGLVLLAVASAAHAGDAFDGIACNADIGKALIGKKIGNEAVAAIEKRHAAIGLRNEGGDELPKSLDYASWAICGHTYHFIARNDVVQDVVRADHSPAAPAFVGTCDDGKASYEVLAILKADGPPQAGRHYAADEKTKLPATQAWRIDDAHAKFVAMQSDNLMCPRSGISTSDGGP